MYFTSSYDIFYALKETFFFFFLCYLQVWAENLSLQFPTASGVSWVGTREHMRLGGWVVLFLFMYDISVRRWLRAPADWLISMRLKKYENLFVQDSDTYHHLVPSPQGKVGCNVPPTYSVIADFTALANQTESWHASWHCPAPSVSSACTSFLQLFLLVWFLLSCYASSDLTVSDL